MPRLRDLEARFIQRDVREVDGKHETYLPWVDTLPEAHGIVFLCPKCFAANGGPVGTHSVICWFEDKVPDDAEPKPGRWNPVGTGIDDLTFAPGKKSNSVLLTGGCNWHGFVTNGAAD
jgi:hypothetical protein